MKSLFIIYFFTGLIFQSARSQVTLRGAQCVLPGMEYQYVVSAGAESLKMMRACITGGQIIGSTSNCIDDPSIKMFRVKWNNNAATGNLALVTSAGNFTLSIKITPPLNPGTISTALRNQTINAKQAPALLICSPASGGGCDAQYSYEWQQSSDRISWLAIPGGIGQNLDYRTALDKPMYFRRKVVNTISNTTAYSDEVAVFVNPEIPIQAKTQ